MLLPLNENDSNASTNRNDKSTKHTHSSYPIGTYKSCARHECKKMLKENFGQLGLQVRALSRARFHVDASDVLFTFALYKLNEKGSQLQTAHRSMFNTNVSPFGLLQCMVDIRQYLVKLGRLQDHIYMYKGW